MKKIEKKLENFVKMLEKKKWLSFFIKYWPFGLIFSILFVFGLPYFIHGLPPFPADFLVNRFPPWQYFYGTVIKNDALPDVVTQMFPFKHLVIGMWKEGIVPLWNPYSFAGTPFLANFQSAVFHPLNWLFFLLPEIDAWSLLILGQLFLAALFAFIFVRKIGLSRLASLLTAFSFAFCGFMTTWLTYGTLSMAIVFLPLALLAIEKIFEKKYCFLILLPLAVAFSFFSGHVQTSTYLMAAVFAYLLFKLVETAQSKEFVFGLIFFCLGIGLTAVQIIPTIELYNLSVRSVSFGVSEVIPFKYLITLLAPDFYGNQVTRNNWLGNYVEMTGFFGVIPLILALLALVSIRNKKTAFFAFVFIFSLILTLPTPLLDLLVMLKLPIISNSAVARLMSLVGFSGAVLAGFGLDRLAVFYRENKWQLPLFAGLIFVIIIGGTWYLLLFTEPFPADKVFIAKRNFILPSLMAGSFLATVGGTFIASRFLAKSKQIRKLVLRLSLILLVGLSIFDLFRFANKWTSFAPREFVYPKLAIIDFLQQETPPNRIFGYFGMELQNYCQLFGFNGYDPLYPKRYGEFLTSTANGLIQAPSTRGAGLPRRSEHGLEAINLLGGKYVLHAKGDDNKAWTFDYWNYPDQFVEVYRGEKYIVLENKKALGRAALFYDWQVVTDDQLIINTLFSPETDSGKTLILEEKTGIEPAGLTTTGEAEIVSYRPNRVEIEVNSPTVGLLFLSDNYYPGWRAEVNNQETKIYRANYSFRAIEIPAGSSTVVFSYQPASFYWGLRVSLVCLAVILIAGLAISIIKKKGKK